jgi:hypothetical protein
LGVSAKAIGMPEDPRDDPSIPNADRLFRRVRPNQLRSEPDGSQRPTSAVFKNSELSVNIESLMIEQGRPPEDTLTNFPNEFLTSIIAGNVRVHGYPIVKDTAPPNDPAHGLVLGRKTNAFANAMVRAHRWIVAPSK